MLKKRPYLRREWCIHVIEHAERTEFQEYNRVRFWARVPQFGNR